MSESEERGPTEDLTERVDAATLKRVVQQIVRDPSAELVSWRVEEFEVGSTRGSVFRVRGSGRSHAETLPWSLVVKFVPSPEGGAVRYAVMSHDPTHHDYWLRELYFYQSDLPAELPDGLAIPSLYHVDEQPDGYWLWMEDIHDTYDQRWPTERFGLAATHLGRFSGQYLADRDLLSLNWLVPHLQRERSIEQGRRKQNVWLQLATLKKKHEILRRAWPDDLLERFTELWRDPGWLYEAMEPLPRTLKHGDAGHKNLLARRAVDGTDETVALDWAFLGIGSIGEEIVPVVVSTVTWFGAPVSQLPVLDRTVFEGYVKGLNESGWQGDPELVRLGYTANAVLRFGAVLSGMPEIVALDEPGRVKIEATMGKPIGEIADNSAAVREYVLSCAEEAMQLARRI